MNMLIILLLFTYLYSLVCQYTKSQLRGMNEQIKRIEASSFSSFIDMESNHIINNVIFKAVKGEYQLRFRILCNSIPFMRQHKSSVKDYDNNNVLYSVLGVDGSYLQPIENGKMVISSENGVPSISERVLKFLTQNKELTEKIVNKLKEQFPDSNITNIQQSYSYCKEYILSW